MLLRAVKIRYEIGSSVTVIDHQELSDATEEMIKNTET